MAVLIGYQFWGMEEFSDDSVSLIGIKNVEASGAIVDDISIKRKAKEKIDQKLYKGDNLETGTIDGLTLE